MAISCKVANLLSASVCMSCIPEGMLPAVHTSLICQWAAKPVGAPNAPSNLNITDASVLGATVLTWTNNGGATTNEVYRSTDNITYGLVQTVAGGVSTWTDPLNVMANNTQYFWKVRAVNAVAPSGYSNVRSVMNILSLASSGLTGINYPFLTLVYSNFDANDNLTLTNVQMPVLRKIGGELRLHGCHITTLDLSSLQHVASYCFFYSNPIVNITLPALLDVGPSFSVDSCLNLTTLSLPLMTQTGDLSMNGCSSLTTLNVPSLVNLLGILTISGTALSGDVYIPNLLVCYGITATGVGGMTSFSTNGPVSDFRYGMDFSGNAGFAQLNVPTFTVQDLAETFTFSGCGMTQSSVDNIFCSIQATAPASGLTIDCSGGTNSAPSGAGASCRDALNANGNFATSN
jgi:hypothetical protein